MIPTITDLSTANDNALVLSKDAEQMAVITRKLANDQQSLERDYQKTISRITSNTSAHADTTKAILASENDNSRESYVRPKIAEPTQAVNKTMDRIMARHNKPEYKGEGHELFSWENDNNKDFYKLASREPDENDHQETMGRILAQRSIQNDAEPANEKEEQGIPDGESISELEPHENRDSLSDKGDKSSEHSVLKSIDNTTTNIFDVLKQMHQTLGDIADGISVDSQRARERALESGQVTGHPDQDSISEAISGTTEDKDKEQDSTLTKLVKIGKGMIAPAITAAAGGAISSLVHHSKHKEGGFDGSQQTAVEKGAGRAGGVVPTDIGPVEAPGAAVEPESNDVQSNKIRLIQAFKSKGFNNREIAQLLGQVEAESKFKSQSEKISVKQAQSMYQNNKGLGNTNAGDGYRYRGRGLNQLTGRANYEHMDKVLGMHGALVNNPDLANNPDVAARIAAQYYSERKNFKSVRALGGLSTAAGATAATAPGGNRSEQIRNRSNFASKYNDATINSLAQGKVNRGSALNVASSQSSAKPPVIVVNNNHTNVNQPKSQSHGSTKPKVPSARSSFWDGWSKYFNL